MDRALGDVASLIDRIRDRETTEAAQQDPELVVLVDDVLGGLGLMAVPTSTAIRVLLLREESSSGGPAPLRDSA